MGPQSDEVYLAFPRGARELVPPATSFKATWLTSSIKAAKERGLFEAYLARLPPRYHQPVLESVPGEWLPVEVAVAHYEAMDGLGLSEAELMAIGLEVTRRFHSTLLSTILRLARTAGATPWTIFSYANRMWDTTWVGGGVGIFRLGPHDARFEVVGWPCSRVPYCRLAMRGVIKGLTELFCRRATVVETPRYITPTSLGWRMTWES